MACLSLLRLGSELSLVPSMSAQTFKELLVSIGLGDSAGRASASAISDTRRARLMRERLIEEFGAVQLTLLEEEETH
jgi:protein-arginine kinase